MSKFDKARFLAGASFPTQEVDVPDLGALTIKKLSARQFEEYLELSSPSKHNQKAKKNQPSDLKLSMMLLQWCIIDPETKQPLFDASEVDQMLESFTGEQMTFLTEEVLIFNGMAKRPEGDEKKS